MSIRKTINKLQSALIAKGYIYIINTYQFYSDQQNRKKNGKMSAKDVKLFNSCSQVEVLKWFVGEWEKRKNEDNS